MDTVKWEDSDAPRWPSDIATVGDLLIEVCLDDEGPFRPAFFFTIERDGVRIDEGWAGSVAQAKAVALDAARKLAQ